MSDRDTSNNSLDALKLADIAIDLDKQFISAAGEIAFLRLALVSMSMLDADSEQLKETAQRILDRSRERWPPEHKPFTSIALLKEGTAE